LHRRELRRTTLTVAILVVCFVDVVLPTLFWLVLAGLAALLALSVLSRLTALLALSTLATWLFFLLHIVSHKRSLLRKRRPSHAFGIYRLAQLSCRTALQGWEGFW
jgi:hypothetical protein